MKRKDFKVLSPVVILTLISLFYVTPVSAGKCANLDIRNNVRSLMVLTNCTVVHGYLHIVLLDQQDNDFTNVSFPNLREITGYLLFFRVYGLVDLGALFPNLVVIRGSILFGDYALVVHGVPELKKVGLRNLLSVDRGFVRIELCQNLCYASTIDWALITHQELKGNRIPGDPKACSDGKMTCAGCDVPHKCWSQEHCQKKIGGRITTCK